MAHPHIRCSARRMCIRFAGQGCDWRARPILNRIDGLVAFAPGVSTLSAFSLIGTVARPAKTTRPIGALPGEGEIAFVGEWMLNVGDVLEFRPRRGSPAHRARLMLERGNPFGSTHLTIVGVFNN